MTILRFFMFTEMRFLISFLIILFAGGLFAQDSQYATMFGGPIGQRAYDMAIDSDKNVVIVGETNGAMDADPGVPEYWISQINNYNWTDLFIAKYDSIGTLLWAHSLGSQDSQDYAKAVEFDSQGNIIVIGKFVGSFMRKYDPNGNLLWAKQLGILGDYLGLDVAIDGNDNILWGVHGEGYFTVDVSGVDSTFAAPTSSAFIYKIDPNGNGIWGRLVEGISRVWAVAVDNSNNVIVGGDFYGYDIDFDPDPSSQYLLTTYAGLNAGFTFKLDEQGDFVWAHNITDLLLPNYQYSSNPVFDLHSDQLGNIYGLTNLMYNYPTLDQVLFKLDPGGALEWNIVNDSCIISSLGTGFAVDSIGNSYIHFHFQTSADVDPGPGVINEYPYGTCGISNPNNTRGTVLQKINPLGDLVWYRPFRLCGGDVQEIVCDDDGALMMNGAFYTGFDLSYFGSGTLTNTGGRDILLAKINQDICSDLTLHIDTVTSLNCNNSAYVEISISGGVSPYQVSFNSQPFGNDSIHTITSPGVYPLIMTDTIGCQRSTNLVFTGPTIQTGFDLDGHLVTDSYRPGFITNATLEVFTEGCDTISGSVILIMDSLVSYISSVPAPTQIIGDSLIWDFGPMNYASPHFTPNLVLETSTSAVIGDTVSFDLIVTPIAGDSDTTNNTKKYTFPVVNGYDPNDKKVYPIGKCVQAYIENNQNLTYTIRFQNTGNSEAIDIVIIDSVITNNLDYNSIRLLASSHYLHTEVLSGGRIKFVFNNINLPPSSASIEESKGYVIFEILPLIGLPHNEQIINAASIFFDFNPPINTNSVLNTVFIGNLESWECTASLEEEEEPFQFIVYPNPSRHNVKVQFSETLNNATVILTNAMGAILKTTMLHSINEYSIDLPESKGLYFIWITDDNGNTARQSVIKL